MYIVIYKKFLYLLCLVLDGVYIVIIIIRLKWKDNNIFVLVLNIFYIYIRKKFERNYIIN